jgi:hypothetical protein
MEVGVRVWGETVKIEVYQKSKTVWIAYGDYMGQALEVKRPTRGAAMKGWVSAATSRGG